MLFPQVVYQFFYIANNAALIPMFGIDRDAEALDTIETLLPDRALVAIDISVIALGGGGIHCIRQAAAT